jgi:hypothetical protein
MAGTYNKLEQQLATIKQPTYKVKAILFSYQEAPCYIIFALGVIRVEHLVVPAPTAALCCTTTNPS